MACFNAQNHRFKRFKNPFYKRLKCAFEAPFYKRKGALFYRHFLSLIQLLFRRFFFSAWVLDSYSY